MGKKRKQEKTKHPRYRAKSPKYVQPPRTCSCGERLVRIKYVWGLRGASLRWQCPKCGLL